MKPAAKSEGLSLYQIGELYNLLDLPSADEYLTARNWRYNKSESNDEEDQVSYFHRKANSMIDGKLNIFLCNQAQNAFCHRPSVHDVPKSQHVYMLIYTTTKPVYEELKAKAKGIMKVTGSNVADNMLITVYGFDKYEFRFILDNSESTTQYVVLFKDNE